MMKNEKRLSDCCETAEQLQFYLEQKAQSHNSYKCYSRIERIQAIVEREALYLNSGENWNDITDLKNFEKAAPGFKNFGKCFSFSQDENVAMWMLYGGIDNRGAMIDFTRSAIRNILRIGQITLGKFEGGQFHAMQTVEQENFQIWITDIVYCNEKTGYLKRSDETCANVREEIIRQLGPCKKAYPWNYENECRLIVSVKNPSVPEECDTVKIDLHNVELGKSMERLYYSPTYQGKIVEGFRESRLSGTIKWDLRPNWCRTCKKTS